MRKTTISSGDSRKKEPFPGRTGTEPASVHTPKPGGRPGRRPADRMKAETSGAKKSRQPDRAAQHAAAQGQAVKSAAQEQAARPATQGQAVKAAAQGQAVKAAAQGQAARPTAQGQAVKAAAQGQAARPTAQGQAVKAAAQGQAARLAAQGSAGRRSANPPAKPQTAGPNRQPRTGGQARLAPAGGGRAEPRPAADRHESARAGGIPAASADRHPLKVIPLGGMREIGKNMFVYEYRDDIIIVDCGIAFPEEDMPGIDVVIPDMSYVINNRTRVRGIFFTHGHEDHIGAVSWLTKDVRAPLYGSKLTIALIRAKLEDRGNGARGIDLRPVEDGAVIKAGSFTVEFIHSNHSIADANILAITSPAGLVIHTGDFKIDYTPINGDPMDLSRLSQLGQQKPLLLMCESTNIEKPGFSMSESKVGESFAGIFEKAPGRIIVATFSSNIFRMQQILTVAERFGRKVCLVGRSILNVFAAANSLGYMKVLPNTLIDVNQIRSYPPEQVVIISTGSQGEPLSALTRMAFSEHQKIEISRGDTVIISSSPIPGNEKSIYRVIDELYLKGANVIYTSLAEVHASGHAYQEELKLVHQLVKSRYFVPMHGEYRMLFLHAQLAQRMGAGADDIFLLSNGDVLEVTDHSARISGYVPAEGILVDGSGFAESGNAVLKDRITLAEDGVITVAFAIDSENSAVLGDPVIHTRGFAYESETDEIVEECKTKVFAFVRKCESGNKPLLQVLKTGALREQLRNYLFERTRRKPIIIISLIEL